MAGFYFVWFGADGRGMGRIEIRFYREIWREPLYSRWEVPHGKMRLLVIRAWIRFLPGALFYRLHYLAVLCYP